METTIHGFNADQIAAMFEYGMNENHPFHTQAKEMIEQFLEAQHQARIERGRRMMQEQIDDMDQDEIEAFHRNND